MSVGSLNEVAAPSSVSSIETVWITLKDGTRLAARLWLPAGSETAPVPAILEYLPYRRRDRHRFDDAYTHPYFAAHGYAAVRVDMRGSGDSDGIMTDEYTPQEWRDALEVIDWIAGQPWCTGRLGMIGLSWSGFNSLQVASFRPEALNAIVTVCASDDRYADDMHYMGGCLLSDNLQYGSTLLTWLATPPDPEVVGTRWRDMWLARLEAVSPPALRWMQHQQRDSYWKSGSIAADYTRITAAVLAVGGWADGYSNSVMRLLSNLPGPRKGLIGPWAHAFPHVAKPGPGIDFLRYVTRWWDHWLKDRNTGLMDEPILTCWIQESEPPRPSYERRQGRWVAEEHWPSRNIEPVTFYLAAAGLTEQPQQAGTAFVSAVASPAHLGTKSGEWCPYGRGPDLPLDQREDDSGSAVFDTLRLTAPLEILGGPLCTLRLAASASEAVIAVRLNDVSSDGVSRRITYGLLNLTHHGGHDRATAIRPGEVHDIKIPLNDTGYVVPVGHHLRVAVSSAYWPLAIGVPNTVRLDVHGGRLLLPLRRTETCGPAELGEPDFPGYPEAHEISPPARGRTSVCNDLVGETTRVEVVRNLGSMHLDDVDLELHAMGSETHSMPWRNPGGACSEANRLARFERGDWKIEIKTQSTLSFEGPDYVFEARIQAFEADEKVFERQWSTRIARSAGDSTAIFDES